MNLPAAPTDWPSWVAIAWPLLAALLLGALVHWALMALARHSRRHATRQRARIAVVLSVPASVALPLLFLSVAVGSSGLPVRWIASLQHLLGIGVMLCATWLAVRAVRAIERRVVQDHPLDVTDNLAARRVLTQTRVISGVLQGAIIVVGVGLALMTFPSVRQLGATLLASAGVVGLVAGIAARPVFGNLIAGLQIALAQPIRIDDVVIVEGEWGRVEEIASTYVVIRIWDERRMVVPLQWFIEHPFQNWTRSTSQLLGTAVLWLDYRTPMADVREALQHICNSDARWDGRVCVAQVTDASESSVQVRLLVSARNSGDLFDLRCAVRERMIEFLGRAHPEALPRLRMDLTRDVSREASAHAQRSALDELRSEHGHDTSRTGSPGAEDVDVADERVQAPS
jgi:small-conductance mechanosensitive channel